MFITRCGVSCPPRVTRGQRAKDRKGFNCAIPESPGLVPEPSKTGKKKQKKKKIQSALVNNKDVPQGRAWPHQLSVTLECLVCGAALPCSGVEQRGAGCPEHCSWAMLTTALLSQPGKPMERRVPQI